MDAINKAITIVGGKTALASRLGITKQAVHSWSSGERPVSIERCAEIEQATNRAVTCEDLRPDLAAFWSYMRSSRGRR